MVTTANRQFLRVAIDLFAHFLDSLPFSHEIDPPLALNRRRLPLKNVALTYCAAQRSFADCVCNNLIYD